MAHGASKQLYAEKLTVPLTAVLCLALDLYTKSLARTHLTRETVLPLFPGLVQLTLTTNTGGAFGIGASQGWLMTFLGIVMITAITIWVWNREKSTPAPGLCERVGIGLLAGGALGNLWDRLTLGQVTDFLEFTFVAFPIFNVADIVIDLGIVFILASYYCDRCRLGAVGTHRLNKDENN